MVWWFHGSSTKSNCYNCNLFDCPMGAISEPPSPTWDSMGNASCGSLVQQLAVQYSIRDMIPCTLPAYRGAPNQKVYDWFLSHVPTSTPPLPAFSACLRRPPGLAVPTESLRGPRSPPPSSRTHPTGLTGGSPRRPSAAAPVVGFFRDETLGFAARLNPRTPNSKRKTHP